MEGSTALKAACMHQRVSDIHYPCTHAGRQADNLQTGIMTIRQTGKWKLDYRNTVRQTGKPKNKQTDRQADKQAGRQTDRQADRQTDRQTD
jgi:hypothetical protein